MLASGPCLNCIVFPSTIVQCNKKLSAALTIFKKMLSFLISGRGVSRLNDVNITKIPQWEMRIRSSFRDLSSAEGKVAESVLRHPDTLLNASIQDLARASGVSEASVVRFCRSMGYRGLKEFKIAVAREHVLDDASARSGRSLSSADTAKAVKSKVFCGCMEALQDTMDSVDDRELARAVDILYKAPYIEVFGVGGSSSVARSALHSFRQIGVRMNVTAELNSTYLRAERFNPEDAVLAISLSGETKAVVDAVRIAKGKGAVVVSITGARNSTLTGLSDCLLFSASRGRMMPGDETYERVAQIAIIHALYAGVAVKLQEEREKTRYG